MDDTRTPFINPELEAIISAYLAEAGQGRAPNREQLIRTHARFDQELRDFFAGLDRAAEPSLAESDSQGIERTSIDQTEIFGREEDDETDPEGMRGQVISDRYTLIDNIGEGGMGAVWLAEQHEPVKRKVALKLVKGGINSREIVSRFEAERQALALMDHPHIAKIFDGGLTEDGRPYFVMEFVIGMTFTEYCDWAKLSLRERLQLFSSVCLAVQHAHQKGIIHRDLKPSNILVNLSEGKPSPKIIDFGLAKLATNQRTGTALDKSFGGTVGTPLYMSPEQAKSENEDIDTRADIYSLGVILYETLSGTTPLDRQKLKHAKFSEVQNLLLNFTPPRPSDRITGHESQSKVAAQRNTTPQWLRRTLANDLDWIAMKAIQKNRSQRYSSASDLARDIERFLNDEVVEACPPSRLYRLKKFVRKHRFAVGSAAALLVTLVIGIVGTTWGYIESKASERRAMASENRAIKALAQVELERDAKEAQRLIAEKAEDAMLASYLESTDDVITQLIGSKDDLGPQERDYLDKTLQRWQAFAERQGDDERSLKYRAEGLYQVGVVWRKLGRYNDARTKLEQALLLQKSLVEKSPTSQALRHELARMQIAMGVLLHEIKEAEKARTEYQSAQTTLRQLTQASPDTVDYQLDFARATGNLGFLFNELGDWDSSRQQYEAARDTLRALVHRHPDVQEYQGKLIKLHRGLAEILLQQEHHNEARAEFESARDLAQKLVALSPTVAEYQFDLSVIRNGLGDSHFRVGDLDQARQEYDASQQTIRQLVEHYPAVPHYRRGLARSHYADGRLLARLGQHQAAKTEFETALPLQQQLVERFPTVPLFRDHLGDTHLELGEVFNQLGDRDAAHREHEAAVAGFRSLTEKLPNDYEYRVKYATALLSLGASQLQRGEVPVAQAQLVDAKSLFQKLVTQFPQVPNYQRYLARCDYFLGGVHRAQEKLADARSDYEAARDLQRKLTSRFSEVALYRAQLADSHLGLGDLLFLQGEEQAGHAEVYAGIDLLRTLVEEAPNVPEYRITLAGVKYAQGRLSLNAGDSAGSILPFIQAIELLKPIQGKEQEDSRARTILRNAHWGKAQAFQFGEQYEESLQDWEQVIALSPENERPGLRLNRANCRLRAGLIPPAIVEVEELLSQGQMAGDAPDNWTAEQLYLLARIYAVASEAEAANRETYATRAIDLLRKSIERGLSMREFSDRIAAEIDLDAIRDRPEFTQLIESLPKP